MTTAMTKTAMTIDDARQAIASGKTKATTLAESFYQTIAAEDPKINAWLALSKERALQQAERVDAMVAKASGTMRSATAAAEPPLDPPGTRSSARGLCTGPYAEFSFDEPIANSSQFNLPSSTAPAASNRATAVASYGGR